jgi:hypothetical protein
MRAFFRNTAGYEVSLRDVACAHMPAVSECPEGTTSDENAWIQMMRMTLL